MRREHQLDGLVIVIPESVVFFHGHFRAVRAERLVQCLQIAAEIWRKTALVFARCGGQGGLLVPAGLSVPAQGNEQSAQRKQDAQLENEGISQCFASLPGLIRDDDTQQGDDEIGLEIGLFWCVGRHVPGIIIDSAPPDKCICRQ